MDLVQFRQSLSDDEPSPDLSEAQQALWWHAKGDWSHAHDCAQKNDDAPSALVHGFLHRVEGDLDNARYWYTRAGRKLPNGSIEDEWDALSEELLSQQV